MESTMLERSFKAIPPNGFLFPPQTLPPKKTTKKKTPTGKEKKKKKMKIKKNFQKEKSPESLMKTHLFFEQPDKESLPDNAPPKSPKKQPFNDPAINRVTGLTIININNMDDIINFDSDVDVDSDEFNIDEEYEIMVLEENFTNNKLNEIDMDFKLDNYEGKFDIQVDEIEISNEDFEKIKNHKSRAGAVNTYNCDHVDQFFKIINDNNIHTLD